MVISSTGNTCGIQNKHVSKAIHNTAIALTTHPIFPSSVHGAALTSRRRCHMLMTIGIAYDTANEMTPTETNARNADEDPRFISPRSICTIVVKTRAQIGTPCLMLT